MEDEDSENGLVDTWTLWEEAYYKEAAIETSLSQMNNSNVSFEEIEKDKEECFYSAYTQVSEGSGNSEVSLNNVIKEFKKNISQENQSDIFKDSMSVPQGKKNNDTKEEETRNLNVKTEKITEYTHYLGLQPTLLQSECDKYNLLENKVSVLDGHLSQHNCLPSESAAQKITHMSEVSSLNSETLFTNNSRIISNNDSKLSFIKNSNSVIVNDAQFLPSTSSKSLCVNSSILLSNGHLELFKTEPILQSSNLKMTRKVYLCAACETYFENWNLFLHMREVHKRYICLFCLGMFGQAERLSHHLSKKHNVSEMTFHSMEEFNDVFKDSCCIVCCSCDKMFSENDNFYHHVCSSLQSKECTSEICSLCRQLNCRIESCILAPDKKNVVSSQYSTNSLKSYNIASFPSNQTVADGRRHSKRTIKPNRLNNDVYLYTKITNIRSKKTMLENTSEIVEGNENINFNLQKNISIKEKTQKEFHEDAVTKNIKISKYTVNSGSSLTNEHLNNLSQNNSHENINNIESLMCNDNRNTCTKIKETVGEISRFVNDINIIPDTEKIFNENRKSNILLCKESKNAISSIDKKSEDNVRFKKTMNELENSKGANIENNSINGVHKNSNLNFESQVCNNLNHINQSLFSPVCEVKENSTKTNVNPQLERVKNNTISSTSTTDRSLIIKICTRNNSVFSISTPISPRSNNIENNKNFRIQNENINRELLPNKALVPEENDSVSDKLTIVPAFENENKISSMVNNSNIKLKSKSDLILNTNNNQQEEEIEHHSYEQDKIMLESKNENVHGTILAGEEIPLTDLNVDNLLESMEIEDLLKQCIQTVCSSCVYCNHARHIAVNGKQLSLHILAEHRFQPQHAAIIIHQKQFIAKLKKNLDSLESYYLNLASYNSKEGTYNTSSVRVYECFHCRFVSTTHKELYLHNRKMHQKPILICIMCKSTFYSYSELLCHLCPGVYAPNFNIQYRCCLCALSNLPSAFRLMVHLRKQHHACDVCLEITGNQQRLSNHVWKHKLHHLCYRCGIAYRNKPDITKHLFWKHGTESILCKKCLQKKWPHIYHFCIPPTTFVCEECGLNFSKAVALKVHKRIHINDFPHACFECTEKFISKKLLTKHIQSHREHLPVPSQVIASVNNVLSPLEVNIDVCNMETEENNTAQSPSDTILKTSFKKVIDVYDLPPLNLSDSDSEIEEDKFKENKKNERTNNKIEDKFNENLETVVIDSQTTIVPNTDVVGVERNEEEKKQEEQIMDGIWDNFKSYTASLEKQEVSNLLVVEIDTIKKQEPNIDEFNKNIEPEILKKVILNDHDYCITYSNKVENQSLSKNPIKTCEDMQITQTFDFKLERTIKSGLTNIQNNESDLSKRKIKSLKKKKQSVTSSTDSSSDSDSSSCSCGTNCSCSSSSSSSTSTSSSSSDSDSSGLESSRKINLNQEKYKEEEELIKNKEENEMEEIIEREQKVAEKKSSLIDKTEQTKKIETMNLRTSKQLVIMESDLATTETETDEDFYDKHPQQLANKLLSEKQKLMLLASPIDSSLSVAVNNGMINTGKTMHSPNLSPIIGNAIDTIPSKRKVKTKKHKKGSRERTQNTSKMSELMKADIPKSDYKKKMFCSLLEVAGRSSTSFKSSRFEKNKIGNSESSELQKTECFENNEFKIGTKRSSKRKRIPKRFYGDSSDEENHKQEMLKWRRIDVPVKEITQLPSTSKINYKQDFQQINYQLLPSQQQELLLQQNQQSQLDKKQVLQQQRHQMQKENDIKDTDNENTLLITASESDLDEQGNTSADSSNSDNNIQNEGRNLYSLPQANIHYSQHLYNAERSNNLYCYCQCPYDEVSEMIACDGDHCQIEWFHFECVGIMIPPKGKWYCPDCRRSLGIPDEIEELANDNAK